MTTAFAPAGDMDRWLLSQADAALLLLDAASGQVLHSNPALAAWLGQPLPTEPLWAWSVWDMPSANTDTTAAQRLRALLDAELARADQMARDARRAADQRVTDANRAAARASRGKMRAQDMLDIMEEIRHGLLAGAPVTAADVARLSLPRRVWNRFAYKLYRFVLQVLTLGSYTR